MTSWLQERFHLPETTIFDHAVTRHHHPLNQALVTTLLLMQKRVQTYEAEQNLTEAQYTLNDAENKQTELENAQINTVPLPPTYRDINASINRLFDSNQVLLKQIMEMESSQNKINQSYLKAVEKCTQILHQLLQKENIEVSYEELAEKMLVLSQKIAETVYTKGEK
jgi:hypothetical protein